MVVCCSSSVSLPLADSVDVLGMDVVSSGRVGDIAPITGIMQICHGGKPAGKYFDTILLI